MSSAVIRAQSLTRRFGGLVAVDALEFSVAPGEIFGLVGPDGAGKTTTMRLLAAILPPSSGDAWVAGHHIVRDSEAIKERIGYMSQRFGLYADLTVLENLHFYADIYSVPRRARDEAVGRLLGFSHLGPFRHRLAGQLSGGMKQKLGLSCALIHRPQVLFLDEPTNGVDPVSRRDFWRILYQLLREGVTIFVSTAYLDEAERCNRIALLHRGRLLSVGAPDEVKQVVRGTLFEVRCAEPRRAVHLLRGAFPGQSVGLFGDRIHLLTVDPETVPARAEQCLGTAGLRLDRIRPVEPSLEDVFVSVLSEPAALPDPGAEGQVPARGETRGEGRLN
jgi:ABC-2 type transport system ATP-binding protein